MADLTTKYLGLTLNSPVIAGSCGLTNSLENIKQIESNGAGAVVLKSIFEEEILFETNKKLKEAEENKLIYSQLSETLDFLDLQIKQENIYKYVKLIKQVKKEVLIPVIASINCTSSAEWIEYAQKIEEANADAIELNLFLNPADNSNIDFLKISKEIISKLLKTVKIPVSVKISQYFTQLGNVINELNSTGLKGIVLFNRFYKPDIDIEKIETIAATKFSSENDYIDSLRWIALMSNKVNCDLCASTGIHDGSAVVKEILAGAKAVQVVSSLYKNGIDYISSMLAEVEKWMNKKGYNYIDQFRGKLSQEKNTNASIYERVQFMKHFSNI